jgi:hypothetical protein
MITHLKKQDNFFYEGIKNNSRANARDIQITKS